MSYDERGELMGHISIGLELVNSLWRKLCVNNADAWKDLIPASEDVRLHLLHLIGAHHGEPEFGSPVSPKTPEAMVLHYIDNLDARLEMFAAGYTTAKLLAETVELTGSKLKLSTPWALAVKPKKPVLVGW